MATGRATQVPLSPADEATLGVRSDYADAFAVPIPTSDDRTPEEVTRAGLEGAPRAIRWLIWNVHRRILGFELAPLGSPDHILGWRIMSSTQDEIRLETRSGLYHGVLIARRADPHTARLVTSLTYDGRASRAVWTIVGPLHRLLAPLLLQRAVRTPVAAAAH